jgi:hypothetical protein
VKFTVMSEHGKEAVVAILDEGQFFGEGLFETTNPCERHRRAR